MSGGVEALRAPTSEGDETVKAAKSFLENDRLDELSSKGMR